MRKKEPTVCFVTERTRIRLQETQEVLKKETSQVYEKERRWRGEETRMKSQPTQNDRQSGTSSSPETRLSCACVLMRRKDVQRQRFSSGGKTWRKIDRTQEERQTAREKHREQEHSLSMMLLLFHETLSLSLQEQSCPRRWHKKTEQPQTARQTTERETSDRTRVAGKETENSVNFESRSMFFQCILLKQSWMREREARFPLQGLCLSKHLMSKPSFLLRLLLFPFLSLRY